MKTRVTELLNIEYPVIQGGMAWVADANLAAHVSKAGVMVFIGAANAPAEWVKEQIHIARKITDKPVGVNIILLSDYADEIAQLVIDEHIDCISAAFSTINVTIEVDDEWGFCKILAVNGNSVLD